MCEIRLVGVRLVSVCMFEDGFVLDWLCVRLVYYVLTLVRVYVLVPQAKCIAQ